MYSPTLLTARFYFAITLGILFYPLGLILSAITKLWELLLPKKIKRNIDGKVALITGAAGGLGKEIAIQLAKRGCKIAIVDINEAAAIETADHIATSYQVQCKAYKVDVSNYEQLENLKKQVTSDLGITTILINNAGLLLFENQFQPRVQEIDQLINVNLKSHFWTKQIFLEDMKKLKRGNIVAISSAMAFYGLPYSAEYASTKAAVRTLMQSLRCELLIEGFHRIHATTVLPTFLDTHKAVREMYERNSNWLNPLIPVLSGEKVAQRIVEGMLRNEEEIVFPAVLALQNRLFGTLRSKWLTYGTAFICQSFKQKHS